jgi:hypothetical protein
MQKTSQNDFRGSPDGAGNRSFDPFLAQVPGHLVCDSMISFYQELLSLKLAVLFVNRVIILLKIEQRRGFILFFSLSLAIIK